MAEKLTMDQKLRQRKVGLPSRALYTFLYQIVKILNRKTHTKFIYKARPSEEEQFVLIGNHASRNDFQFTVPAAYPKMLNFVVGYNEFFRFPVGLLLRMAQVIPKRNFTPDVYAAKQIFRVAKAGGNIAIMPEGMSSITGMAQPVIPGSAELLKKLGLPVYYCKTAGGYLTYTKHCLDERVGQVEVTVDRMFTSEQLQEMSLEEIEDTMNRLLAHDDYIWNKERQISFNGKGQMAKKLGDLLYLCPKCGALYRMECSGNRMRCAACGNEIEIDEKYNIAPVGDSVCPPLVTDWTILERERAAADVRKEGFTHSGRVKVGVIPDHRWLRGGATSEICGEGQLTLDGEGLRFVGTLKGEPYEFFLPISGCYTYGMCTDISRFYTFVKGKFIEFYPEENDVLRWDHLTEEMHRFKGGVWQNTQYRHHED